jgi:hypothetical protein
MKRMFEKDFCMTYRIVDTKANKAVIIQQAANFRNARVVHEVIRRWVEGGSGEAILSGHRNALLKPQ